MTKARDIASAAPAPSTVSATELGYLDGVSSAVQTQLDAKTAKSTLSTTGDIYYASAANTPARLGIGSTGNVLTVASGIPSWTAPAAGVSNAIFRDEKTSGTNGGTFTSGAWRTRDINATQVNTITGASIASNQITLPAGTFYVEVSAPAFAVDQNQARLQNITDSTTTIIGQCSYTAPAVCAASAIIVGQFTITSSKTFEVQHQCNYTRANDGFGTQNAFGTQVYTTVSISKVG
jgi:hypothetical protein